MEPFNGRGSLRMAGDPLCEGARALGHSLPSWHWWLSLTATDQGTWFAGIGAFAAAIVALGIALSDGFRRRRERKARARLTMASLYSPMVGALAMVTGIGRDAQTVLHAFPGGAVLQIASVVVRLKNGCDVLRVQLTAFSPAEAVHLDGDYGVALAAAVRDAELIANLVTSATDVYLPGIKKQAFQEMYSVLQSLKNVPAQALAIEKRMRPFIEACARELGELEEGEQLPPL